MSKKRNYAVVSNEDNVTDEGIVMKEDNKIVAAWNKVKKPLGWFISGCLVTGLIAGIKGMSSSRNDEADDDYDFDVDFNNFTNETGSTEEVKVENF